MKRTPRKPSNLSESLHHQLNSYAIAAAAVGVGALALGQPAEAKIIYTKTNVNVTNGLGLDLNNDGINDFSFTVSTTSNVGGTFAYIKPAQSKNLIWGKRKKRCCGLSIGFASALHAGVAIRANRKLRASHTFMCSYVYRTGSHGSWQNVQNRYLGLKFYIGGKAHYGWARLSFSSCRYPSPGTLTGYAYETISNKPIIAGKTKRRDVITVQPASLGHLARGASGLPAWRRTNSVAASH